MAALRSQTNGETNSKLGRFVIEESGEDDVHHIDREDLPGRPVCAVPVASVEGLALGDHVLLETAQEPYHPWYQSGLVVETDVQRGRMQLVRYKKERVSKEWVPFETFHQVYLIPYTHCRYSQEEAIERAEHRVRWEESLYHPLFNNSHHLVTWAKTGRENPLTEVIRDLEHKGNTNMDLTLTKVKLSSLEEMEPGDHIMMQSEHWLVQSIDLERSEFAAFSWKGGMVTREQWKWNENGDIHQFQYDPYTITYAAGSAVVNAERDVHMPFSSSDEFVTMMKTGRKETVDNSCIFTASGPVSYTKVTSSIAIDEGDHLILKDAEDMFRSVILYKYVGDSSIVAMPDLKTMALYGQLDLSAFKEVYRVNYQESLPAEAVLRRACSQVGEMLLKGCGEGEADKFISWAKTGQVLTTSIAKLQCDTNTQIAQLRPWQRERIFSIREVKVGDHLIKPIHGHWFHFMPTACGTDPTDPYNTRAVYCFRGSIQEDMVDIDPKKEEIYRICYPESLPTHIAIQRARSKLGTHKLSPLARMWFVRWAKTGSDEGIEVDFLCNNAVPVTKSRIVSFAQLNPGDYLVEKEQKLSRWHHYLVTENHSPTACSVIESWGTPAPDEITESQLCLKKTSTYYRLNYANGACISPEHSINMARSNLHMLFLAGSSYTRQRFVNFIKTRTVEVVSVDDLLDDRLFIPREKIHSLHHLKPGDHIECLTVNLLGRTTLEHSVYGEAIDGKRCRVLTEDMEWEEYIFNGCHDVFRVSYPERIPPCDIAQLPKRDEYGSIEATSGMSSEAKAGSIWEAVLGDRTTRIHVTQKLHHTLQYCNADILKPVTYALGITATKSTPRQLVTVQTRDSVTESTRNDTPHGMTQIRQEGASFNLGRRVTLGSTMMLGGPGLGLFVIVEAPLLARGVYKLYRKNKFEHISKTEYKRGVIREGFTLTNTVIGAAGGAIVGQALIPVPVLGAGIGGVVGAFAGQIAGKVEGYAVSRFVDDKTVTLPVIIRHMYTDVDSIV